MFAGRVICNVHLLERVVAGEPVVPAPVKHIDGIAIRGRDAGHRVGGSGAGWGHADADLTRSAGVSVGGMNGGLLVTYQNVA